MIEERKKIIFWRLERWLTALERRPLGWRAFWGLFSALVVLRMTLTQYTWEDFFQAEIRTWWREFFANWFSFAFLFVLLTLFLSRLLRRRIEAVANVLLVGFWIILLPGLVQRIWFPGALSYYEFASLEQLGRDFLTIFANDPLVGVSGDMRLQIILGVLGIWFYVLISTRRFWRALVALVGSYAVFFLVASLPSWIVIATRGPMEGFWQIDAARIAGLFTAPSSLLAFSLSDPSQALAARMNVFYLLALAVCGGWFFAYRFKCEERAGSLPWRKIFPWALLAVFFLFLGAGVGLWLTSASMKVLFMGYFSAPAAVLAVLGAAALGAAAAFGERAFTDGRSLAQTFSF
ncbi:MAG TPA: hypothetical protein ENJ77_01285, partial [Candidatus Moranbacteria bacterium]|nr:hypothetical protein [Candidatus Moranbacteria bacterium]